MPSGAKKRKAAKKKKEQEASSTNNSNSSTNNNNSSNPLGNDDPKSQDERESDGGDVGSPGSQDHQQTFKETSENFEKRDPSPVRSFDTENKPMEVVARDIEDTKKVGTEGDGATRTESKSEEDLGSQSISIKHIVFGKESHDGSSSSSSSDDESEVDKKKSEKAAYDSISQTTSLNGEDKPVDPFAKEVIHGTEKASFWDAAAAGDSVKTLVTVNEEVIHVPQSDSVENSLVPDLVETRLEEKEESNKNEEKIIPMLEENVGAHSTVVEGVANGNESKVLPTSDVSTAATNNGVENIRDSKIPDSSENQPLIASAPQVAQRSSWMSCCGLLDVLTGR